MPLKGSALSRSRWSRSPGFVFRRPELPGCEGTLRWTRAPPTRRAFIALLRKPGDSAAVPGLAWGTAATAALPRGPPAFLAEFGLSPALLPPGDLAVFEDSLHFLPAPALAHLPAAVRWQGMALGKASAQGLIPRRGSGLCLIPNLSAFPASTSTTCPSSNACCKAEALIRGCPAKRRPCSGAGFPSGVS